MLISIYKCWQTVVNTGASLLTTPLDQPIREEKAAELREQKLLP